MSRELDTTEELFLRFPKSRPPLPDAYREIYEKMYCYLREGQSPMTGASLWLEEWMHRRVADCAGFPLLEIGGGTLNHVKFENKTGIYDVVEPQAYLYEGKAECSRVRRFFRSIDDVPTAGFYRRIISVAVLEHILELPEVLAKTTQLLNAGGIFLAGVPSEGALAWYMGWRFGTGMAFRRRFGLDYSTFIRYEHVNDCSEMERLIRYFYREVKVRRFPFKAFQASFYTFIEAGMPNLRRAKFFLERGEVC